MAETRKSFSKEQIKAFEEKYNLWVYNHEAMIELFMRLDTTLFNFIETYNFAMSETQMKQQKQQEQIDEIAKNTHALSDWGSRIVTLYAKWNSK